VNGNGIVVARYIVARGFDYERIAYFGQMENRGLMTSLK
jgi:hypothetical protein